MEGKNGLPSFINPCLERFECLSKILDVGSIKETCDYGALPSSVALHKDL